MTESNIKNDKSQCPLAPATCSASAWTGHLVRLEHQVDCLRATAYNAKNYQLAAALQEAMRAIAKIRYRAEQTPNEKS
jgi:hypothetical protein